MGPKGAETVAAASGAAGLTDTDILIDAARGVADALSFLNTQRIASGLYVSIKFFIHTERDRKRKGNLRLVHRRV